jgi:hypothetical protein
MGRLMEQQTVTFRNPTTGEPESGRVLDQIWAKDREEFCETAPESGGWREVAHTAQLIEWPDGNKSVRITYWARKSGGGPSDWYFAGQFASSIDLPDFHRFLARLCKRAESPLWKSD